MVDGLDQPVGTGGEVVACGSGMDLGDPLEIGVAGHPAQGGELLLADRQPELGLRLGEQDPEPAPGRVAVPGGEDRRHARR